MQSEITEEKLDRYFGITEKALKLVTIAPPKGTELYRSAQDFFDMASRYFSDARHFREQGNKVNAFAAINYAHGWLDAGARLGLFEVDKNSDLFTVD